MMKSLWRIRIKAGKLLVLWSVLSMGLPAHAETYAVVVSGLGGEPEYSEAFSAAGDAYTRALNSLENGSQRIVHLQESATRETILQSIRERAAAMNAAQAATQAATEADTLATTATATFVLILVGHGTADSDTWRFNVTGPDLTTEDLIAALNEIPAARQLVILAASASGAALEALAQPQRVVVSATKSGGEINAVQFPKFLADAMESSTADFDRNEMLTVAEAFRFANARTEEYYEQQKLLASEHARLEGDLAEDIPVALLGSLRQAQDNPEVAALLSERLLLEEQFKGLSARKQQMSIADFYQELEVLLLEIARLQQSIDAVTGWSEPDAES